MTNQNQGMNVEGLADQSGFFFEFHHGWIEQGVFLLIDQSEFLGNFTMQGYKRGVTSVDMSV